MGSRRENESLGAVFFFDAFGSAANSVGSKYTFRAQTMQGVITNVMCLTLELLRHNDSYDTDDILIYGHRARLCFYQFYGIPGIAGILHGQG